MLRWGAYGHQNATGIGGPYPAADRPGTQGWPEVSAAGDSGVAGGERGQD
jgi:hypothetical protein